MIAGCRCVTAPALFLASVRSRGRLDRRSPSLTRLRDAVLRHMARFELRHHSPMAVRQTGDHTRQQNIESWSPFPPGGRLRAVIAARFRLCATFPTGRGDKFTDAELPPRLPLLRDSKSFVKRISPLAEMAEIRPYFRSARRRKALHRSPTFRAGLVPSRAPFSTSAS